MSIIALLIVLVVVGVALYMINTFIPMAQPIKIVINVIVVLVLVVWLLESFGMMGNTFHSLRLR